MEVSGGTGEKRKLVLSALSLVFALIFATLVFAVGVFAHEKDQYATVYKQSGGTGVSRCTNILSRVADGNYGNGFTRGRVDSVRNGGTAECEFPDPKKSQNIRLVWFYMYDTDSTQPRVCATSPGQGWLYNNENDVASFTNIRDWEHKPCGHGFYSTTTWGQRTYGAGNWQGGGLDSGRHFFGQ